jgi:hypothetical protein
MCFPPPGPWRYRGPRLDGSQCLWPGLRTGYRASRLRLVSLGAYALQLRYGPLSATKLPYVFLGSLP